MIAYLDDRTVLVVSGEDVRDFLNGLVTNDVSEKALTPETPVWAGLLSAQGKYLADMILFDGGEAGIFIDVHKDRAADLAKKLKLYRLRRAIEIGSTGLRVFAGWNRSTRARRTGTHTGSASACPTRPISRSTGPCGWKRMPPS